MLFYLFIKIGSPSLRERLEQISYNQFCFILAKHFAGRLTVRAAGRAPSLAAACANGVEHLASSRVAFLRIAACLAALGLVLETTACVELLLYRRSKRTSVGNLVLCLVFVHSGILVYLPVKEFNQRLGSPMN